MKLVLFTRDGSAPTAGVLTEHGVVSLDVFRGPARRVQAADWRAAVFGYTCVIDVMARGDTQFGRDFWLAKSDTLGPLGPCIVTADEIPDPAALHVTSFVNGQLSQDYRIG